LYKVSDEETLRDAISQVMSNLLDDKPFNTIGDVEASAAK
jgi:hypothetical protein